MGAVFVFSGGYRDDAVLNRLNHSESRPMDERENKKQRDGRGGDEGKASFG